jgi:hypothetical protein
VNSTSRPQPWIVRPYHAGDEDGITLLFRHAFGRTLPEGYWGWKLRHWATEVENEWVADMCGRIIGHYAVTPLRCKFGDREVIVPHGCDAVTHREYRCRGIFTALGRRANEVWAQAGSPFQIGFHYGGWGSVRESLGWKPLARLVWMKYWIRPLASLAQQLRLPDLSAWGWADPFFSRLLSHSRIKPGNRLDTSDIQLEQTLCADERFDRLWKRLSAGQKTLIIRDRAWVQWRCLDMPGAEHHVILAMGKNEPLGYIAFRVTQGGNAIRAAIVDYFFAPGDVKTAAALLGRAISEVSVLGARNLAVLAMPDSPQFRFLLRAGFRQGRHGYDFSIIPYQAVSAERTAAGWFITGSEGDVI